jgi:NPCBM/NEW2 domain-containing protein
VNYTQSARQASNSDERIIRSVPPPPSPGTDAVSDLPFLSATNGWGPVERDTSNGEQAAGDGHPITINGVSYAKGLGTNSISDVEVYLGGRCTRFTAMVGVDDEKNGAGTVTFSVAADGKTLVTTPTIRGHQPATPIDVASPARRSLTPSSATQATATATTTATGRYRPSPARDRSAGAARQLIAPRASGLAGYQASVQREPPVMDVSLVFKEQHQFHIHDGWEASSMMGGRRDP